MSKKKPSSAVARKSKAPSKSSVKSKSGGRATKTVKKKPRKRAAPTLGRPKITGEEMLFMLFHDDYHSRQVFDFLRVQTVKELEQFTPQQIFKLLSKPISDTVNSIRRRLAEKNRYLLDDIEFAVEFQNQANG